MPQSTLTIVTEVARADDLQKLLGTLQARLKSAFTQVAVLHFARIFVVPGLPDLGLEPQLVFALVFDGTPRGCVEQVVASAWGQLETIYGYAPAYANSGTSSLADYLLGLDIKPGLFYHGAEDVDVATIAAMAKVRDTLRRRLDVRLQHGGSSESTFSLATEALLEYEGIPETTRAIKLPEPDRRSKLAVKLLTVVWGLALLALALVVAAVPTLIGYAISPGPWVWSLGVATLLIPILELRRREMAQADKQENKIVQPEDDHLRQVLEEEDRATQNALSHCALVEGLFHRVVLAIVFFAIGLRVRWVDNRAGSLGGITSIHFGRWVLIDKGKKARRLIFMSDYDGSWESYLGEFVDRAAKGLSAVWGNTRDFPATLFLMWRGARNEQKFKSWTRANQLSTPVWYSAYEDRTLRNIENDLVIARGAPVAPAPPKEPAWLASL